MNFQLVEQFSNIQFNLSKPINKYWYSKHKKQLIRNNTNFIKCVLADAINRKIIIYSQKYYSCAKFIKSTTNLKFIKRQKNIYYVKIFNDDFIDTYIIQNNNDFKCMKKNIFNNITNCKNIKGGKNIGKCKNNCCQYYSKNDRFYIQWI